WSAESWFMRHSPLNAALGDGQESPLLSSSQFSLSIRFSKSAIQYCRPKFLNLFGRKTTKVRGLRHWFSQSLVVNFTGSKCGKGKLIEAFVLALLLQLYVSAPQKQLDR
ncbi:hypothetical protein ACP51X_004587, partial [Vibrio vulnificus]